MNDHTYKVIELVGSSPDSIEGAVDNALSRAGETLHNLRWFEITQTRGHIEGGRVGHYQVCLKVGFSLDEE